MKKADIKTATVGEIITDYVMTSTRYVLNLNMGGAIAKDFKHMRDLEDELVRRGVLTQEQIDILNR